MIFNRSIRNEVPLLEKHLLTQIEQINQADILVGIPSFNNAKTIGHVVRAVRAGLAKYFPDMKSVLLNSDGGSTDGTMDVVKNATDENLHTILLTHHATSFFKITTSYPGIPGKGSAFRTIFEVASRLHVKACCVIDSDLRSITPEWIELLLKPILQSDFDYVAPLYHRHKFDGTITNNIIYPLTRALYGKKVRQPIGGEFGFSGKLAHFYLSKDVWGTDVARFGIDIWMTTTAITNNFKVCQSYLGAKIHDAKDPGTDLSSMLFQVVGSAFELMEEYETQWMPIRSSTDVPTFGFHYAVGLEPVPVNLDRLIEKFHLGVKDLRDIWSLFLPKDIISILVKSQYDSNYSFFIPDNLWARIIYCFANAFRRKTIHKEHLLKSLTPLYLGRTASFISEVWDCNSEEVEQKIDRLCDAFENEKTYLVNLWI